MSGAEMNHIRIATANVRLPKTRNNRRLRTVGTASKGCEIRRRSCCRIIGRTALSSVLFCKL